MMGVFMRQVLAVAALVSLALPVMVWGDGPQTQPATQPVVSARDRAIASLRQRLDSAIVRMDDYEGGIASVSQEIRDNTGRIEVSPEVFHQAAGKLDDEVEALTEDDVAARARLDAIAKAMNQIADDEENAANRDPAVIALQKVVDQKSKNMALMTNELAVGAGGVNQGEINTAEADLAEAEAQVAIQREHSAAAAGGDMVMAMKKELIDLTVDQQEREARIKFLEDQRQRLLKGEESLDRLTTEQDELQNARQEVERLREELDRFTGDSDQN